MSGDRTGEDTTGESQTSNTENALTQHRVHEKLHSGVGAHSRWGSAVRKHRQALTGESLGDHPTRGAEPLRRAGTMYNDRRPTIIPG
ncbi:hypothetical protein, partial [Micromonospora sp. I033]